MTILPSPCCALLLPSCGQFNAPHMAFCKWHLFNPSTFTGGRLFPVSIIRDSEAMRCKFIRNLGESSDDDFVVIRRIELEEAIEKLLKTIGRVNFLLDYHFKNRLAKIVVWVVGILLDCDAVRDADRYWALDSGGSGGGGAVFVVKREAAILAAGAGRGESGFWVVVVGVKEGGGALLVGFDDIGEFWLTTATAAGGRRENGYGELLAIRHNLGREREEGFWCMG
ncbi:uncharacterized protein LOC111434292 [Cucurbita moschata]|uniref:Uncharacterized protein LOC111434292 n=1 Tax=Cucurbita moschata TaxID=3662 RepID=A0A6J1EI36_CUCMO|nr:uncharacterized protein LOC111434292 [Cucurbita moschata]